MITASRLLRLSLGVSVCVAATSVAAQAIAPETTATPTTDAGAQQQDPAPIVSFEQWLADFRQRALAAGIRATTLDNAFAGVTPDPSVQALDQQQPEFTRYLWDYLDARVTPSAIQEGQQLLISQHALFQKLRQQYGVDPGILTAIWSMESGYGTQIGDFYVIRSLATLAHEGRRTTYGNTQLLAALQILQTEKHRSLATGGFVGRRHGTNAIRSEHLSRLRRRRGWRPEAGCLEFQGGRFGLCGELSQAEQLEQRYSLGSGSPSVSQLRLRAGRPNDQKPSPNGRAWA